MKKFNRVSGVSKGALMVACVLLISALPMAAFAATGGGGTGVDPFGSTTAMLIGWLKGGLGLLLSLISFGVGIAAGIRAGSIWGVVIGLAVALACYWSPDILQSIFGATLIV